MSCIKKIIISTNTSLAILLWNNTSMRFWWFKNKLIKRNVTPTPPPTIPRLLDYEVEDYCLSKYFHVLLFVFKTLKLLQYTSADACSVFLLMNRNKASIYSREFTCTSKRHVWTNKSIHKFSFGADRWFNV